MDVLDCHPDIMEKVYKAHHRFGNLLHDERFQVNFRLGPGDIYSFNNRRILHGRTAFDPDRRIDNLPNHHVKREQEHAQING